MSPLIPLDKLPLGNNADVKALKATGGTKRRMLDLGLIKDTSVEALQKSPSGDPTAYYFRGTVFALRSEEASQIMVSPN